MKYIYVFYALFLIIFVIFSYLFIDPNLSYLSTLFTGFSFTNRTITSVFFVFITSLFFVFYVYFLNAKRISAPLLRNLVLISAVCLIFSYPTVTSYDVFNYMTTARVAYFYQENPYIVMPNEFIGDDMLRYTRAANKTALYGPVWILLTFIPYVFGFSSFLITLFFFKLLVGIFYLGLVFLVFRFSKKNIQKTLFFALNPLVLIETFVAGHNDVVMMFFVFASLYCLAKKNIFLSVIFLIMSICIKFSTLFLIPIYIHTIFKMVKKDKIDFQRIWKYSLLLMVIIFLLSPIREELYPWYAIWFIPFVALIDGYKNLKRITIALCFGLLLSYVPYMLTGVYSFNTYLAKHIIILVPVAVTVVFELIFKNDKNI